MENYMETGMVGAYRRRGIINIQKLKSYDIYRLLVLGLGNQPCHVIALNIKP